MARRRAFWRIRRFVAIGARRRSLLAEACLNLLLARLALVFVPFPRLARRLGDFVPPTDARVATARAVATGDEVALAEEISWATTRAARYVPFRAVCLPQAMTAQMMLRRRGVKSVMHFGAKVGGDVARPDRAMSAHAWLDAAGVEVTGYPVASEFAEIACFV